MEQVQVEHLTHQLYAITPVLIDDLLTSFQAEPQLTARYNSSSLRLMAEQGVVSFRDVMLGALEFDAPGLLSHELNWLDRLLQARHLDGDQVHTFLQIFDRRIRSDLTSEESAPLLVLLRAVKSRLNEM